MKFNWGHGISLGIILFVGFILSLVYITTQQNLNLVDEEYYPKELEHQAQMERIKNAFQFKEEFKISIETDYVTIVFPKYFHDKNIEANILFYRPSDNRKDVIQDYEGQGNKVQKFVKKKFDSGIYVLKITWNAEGKSYYFEQEIAF